MTPGIVAGQMQVGGGGGHQFWRVTNITVSTLDWQPTELQLWEGSSTRADDAATSLTDDSTVLFGTIDRLVDGNYGAYVEFYPFTTARSIFWDFGAGITKAVTGFKHADRGGGGTGSAMTTARLEFSDDNSTWTAFGDATGIAFSPDTLSAFIPFL